MDSTNRAPSEEVPMLADFSGGDAGLEPNASCPPSPGGLGEKQALVPQGVRAPFCLPTFKQRSF
jgi:hypothetical protein